MRMRIDSSGQVGIGDVALIWAQNTGNNADGLLAIRLIKVRR